jgi:hypothetical protein
MANVEPFEILVGVGELFVGPASEPEPLVTATPAGLWVSMGETDGGVTITPTQSITTFNTDQTTAPVKAIRTDETLTIETNLAEATLEHLAAVLSQTVTDTPPTTAITGIGTREMTLYRGPNVAVKAVLFRGVSPYGDFNGQFYIPYGFMDGDTGMSFSKDGKTLIPVSFQALADPNASSEADKFGHYIVQDAASLS